MSPTRKRILCVEDNAEDCDFIKAYLEREGYEAVFAGTIAEALDKAKSERFDLYLLDEYYPDGTGTHLAQQIRTFDSTTPLAFHSASTSAEDETQIYTKPCNPDYVINIIKTLIAAPETIIECDHCSANIKIFSYDNHEIDARLKELGWWVKDGDLCPECWAVKSMLPSL